MLSPVFLARLRELLPADSLLFEREDLVPYESDGLSAYRNTPDVVALPSTEAEVAAILRLCHQENVAVVARGAGTDRLSGRRAAHVVDAQIDGRGRARPDRMRHHRRTAAGVHQRRDDAAMDHAAARIADQFGIPRQRDHRPLGADILKHHAKRPRMRDRLDELARDALALFALLVC